ncbi:tyrosinase family protein [Burkholderia ubonensis]|nr:tyrosinase family protein [Burkholderia ubonensis]
MAGFNRSRRGFLGASASALSLTAFPKLAFATTETYTRLEWQQFKLTPQYTSFLNAIGRMRANTDATSRNSLQYWADIHHHSCPHRMPYFLAWHRGYIYYFEQQLRLVSGDSALNLPYWDYYSYCVMPAEFTDNATGNPLFASRMNTNVYSALDLSPFAPTVVTFQRGTTNSFEAAIETAPHNPVHNIIGNTMATMVSPLDPIFYLHHANVDRLWRAWALPNGGSMPAPTDPYWAGSFNYATNLTMSKVNTYLPSGVLGYDYANVSGPTALPAESRAAQIIRVQAQVEPVRRRPPILSLAPAGARAISAGRRSIGGVTRLRLTEESVSARVVADTNSAKSVHDMLLQTRSAYEAAAIGLPAQDQARAQTQPGAYRSILVVFDDITLTIAGRNGGYFYNVYLNLPDGGDVDTERSQHFLGTFGPFEVAGAAHSGSVMLDFPATLALLKMSATQTREYVVSLVRVNGPKAPKGLVMRIGELRVELSTAAPFISTPVAPRMPGDAN